MIPFCNETMKRPTILLVLYFLAATAGARAATINVASLPDLEQAIANAAPGDQITLADGRYDAMDAISIAAAGTADAPILITAATVGGAEIRGAAGFRLKAPAAYVVIQGFVFAHKAGEMALPAGVHHCRITRNVFELAVADNASARYLHVVGDDNEIDHNEFRNKNTEGQMLHVEGPGDAGMAQRTWIHHNYFHDFKNSRRNNSSALHIGHSARSMTPAHAVVEHNLFERTEGENEGGVCNKSSDNIYRFNTFGDHSSELSLRHGKRCLVYANFFIGGNGIRFFSHDHRIYSNYFENCRPAISIGNGDATIPPGKLTSHERPDRVHITYNTLVNNRANVRLSGRRNGLGANDLVFANNIIVGGDKAVTIDGPLANPTWEGNILWHNDGGPGDIPTNGFVEQNPGLATRGQGGSVQKSAPTVGNGAGEYAYVTIDIDGQPRGPAKTIGADEPSSAPIANRSLTPADVGPNAPAEERPWISAPQLD